MFFRHLLLISLLGVFARLHACDVCGAAASTYTSLSPQWGKSQAGMFWQHQRYQPGSALSGTWRQTAFAQWLPTRHLMLGLSQSTDAMLRNPMMSDSLFHVSRASMLVQGGFRIDNQQDSVSCPTRKGLIAMVGVSLPVWSSPMREQYRTPDAMQIGLFPTRFASAQVQYAWSKTKWGFFADAGCTLALRHQSARQGHTTLLNVSLFRRYEHKRFRAIGFAALRHEYAGYGQWETSGGKMLLVANTGGQALSTTLSTELYFGKTGFQLSGSIPLATTGSALRSPMIQTGFRFLL